jgi:hypothetical protein
LLGNASANTPLLDDVFLTCNNGVTGKRCSLRGPFDIYMTHQMNCREICFLCGPCRGYITSSNCDYKRVFETAVRRVGVVRQSSASKDVNTEAEEATALEAVTRRQPVKIQQTEKTSTWCSELQSV